MLTISERFPLAYFTCFATTVPAFLKEKGIVALRRQMVPIYP